MRKFAHACGFCGVVGMVFASAGGVFSPLDPLARGWVCPCGGLTLHYLHCFAYLGGLLKLGAT